MKLTAIFYRRIHQLNVPLALLMALLQRTPVVRVAIATEEFVVRSPLGAVLKSAAALLTALTTVDTLAGATELAASKPNPAPATTGTSFTVAFAITGTISSADWWVVSGAVPPGLTFNGGVTSGRIDVDPLVLSGTPTTAGSYTMMLVAGDPVGGESSPFPYTVNVTGAGPAVPAFTTQPQSQTADAGATVTFTAAASGSPTYQWRKGGANLTGQTAASLTLNNVQAADAGDYTVVATNGGGSTTSAVATLTVNVAATVAPTFAVQPTGFTLGVGMSGVLRATVNGTPTPTLQWKKGGVDLAGETGSTLRVTAAGSYTVVAASSAGSATSDAAAVALVATDDVGRLLNLSIRTDAASGSQTLIVGFVVAGGSGGVTKPLLVRAVGPRLGDFGIATFLPDPRVDVVLQDNPTPVATNDNWGGDAQISAVGDLVGAFPLGDAASKDAAVYFEPSAGVFTAVVTDAGSSSGIALAEVYDASVGASAQTPRLTNVSARTQVGTGEHILIAGFVIGGQTARTVLVRGVGPTLGTYGVAGTLSDPKLELYASGAGLLAENDDWQGEAAAKNVADAVGAFALASDASKDAVLLITLAPGVYTAQVSGVGSTTGVALVELYEVP